MAPKPARLGFEEAAVLPNAAFPPLRDHGHVQPGQQVLLVGASAAVTSVAEFAKAFGGEVTGRIWQP